MKTSKLTVIVAAGVVLAAASAKADKEFNISGAVAFRDTSYRAINALYGANVGSINADTPGQSRQFHSGHLDGSDHESVRHEQVTYSRELQRRRRRDSGLGAES
ncbi:MAG: hypothetical protein V9H26_20695 [Verrucomicrobiota bacterium]